MLDTSEECNGAVQICFGTNGELKRPILPMFEQQKSSIFMPFNVTTYKCAPNTFSLMILRQILAKVSSKSNSLC